MSGESITFTRGSLSQPFTIAIRDDTKIENSENFLARLSVNTALYPGVRLAPNTATVNIRDNDGKNMCSGGFVQGYRHTTILCVGNNSVIPPK